MKSLIAKMQTAALKRAQFNRTVAEIEKMPLDVALDLNIYKGDARRIAYQSVYGA